MADNSVLSWINYSFAGIEVYRVGVAFLICLVTLIINKVFSKYLLRVAERLTQKTDTRYDDLLIGALNRPAGFLIFTMGIYYAISALQLPAEPYDFPGVIHTVYKILISFIIIITLYRLVNLLAEFLKSVFARADEELAMQFAPLITQALRITIFILGVLLIVQNLGYSIGSLLAGFGIGGLAIALAAQDTLANLFGTLVMVADKPFKIGDWVTFKGVDGDVESIGLRSTKVRTWSKSLKIVPNKLLTSEIIENWAAMPKRRVKMTIGITYDSPRKKVEELRDTMEQILIDDPDVNQEYLLVYFTDFAPSSLGIFVYYFTKTTVWKDYLVIRQRINLKFMAAVEDLGLSFAFPSQTLYMGDSEMKRFSEDLPD